MKNSMEGPQKTKNRVAIGSCNPILGHTSGENSNLKRYMHLSVHCGTVSNSEEWTQPKCPSTGTDKEGAVHV